MASSHFDNVAVLWANYMQASLLSTLFSLVYALKDYVRLFWLINCDHFHFISLASMNHSWERFFANFTLKFCEIVRNHHSCDLFLDFAINPHLKTLYMDTLAWTFAFTRWDQKVIRRAVITKAELAVSCNILICLMNTVKLS